MKFSLLLSLLLVTASASCANTKLSVLTEDWYPFNYQKGEQVVGTSTEFVKQLLDIAEVEYQIEIREWSEAYAILKNEPNTLLYSTFKTPKRAPLFHWICPINEPVFSSAYALSDRLDISATTYEELKPYSIGITQETYPYHLFKDLGFVEGENIQATKNNSSNLGMLLRRRVDIIIESDIAIVEMMQKHKVNQSSIKKLMTIEDPDLPEICLAISKSTSDEVVQKLKQAHKKLLRQQPMQTKS